MDVVLSVLVAVSWYLFCYAVLERLDACRAKHT